ncbi:hypothetical protein DEO72_LG3g697 [Vigna unguiculata]|uniref:Uncharacterized protein n=1 Tax=Vigna unguiculata TaxID=3917 RepID=A0A4D6LCQ9_VIGUN|nr:hypothetical protein DEO72_LG3g697 [Vigna unguiculata]
MCCFCYELPGGGIEPPGDESWDKGGNSLIIELAHVQKSGYDTHDLMHRLAVDDWPPGDSVLSEWCEKSGEMLGIGMLVKDEGKMEEGKKREGAYDLGMREVRDWGVDKSMRKVLFWYGAWRYTDTRQAMDLTRECAILRCAWRHVELRQAVTRKQWVWEDAGAWRYSHGEVRMFRAHVERCHVQGGTGAGGSHVLDYGRAGIGMLVKDEGKMEEGKKREGAYDLGMREVRDWGVDKSMRKVLFWYGAWRYTDTRQAMDLTRECAILRCAWRHVELRQAVTRKQWVWEDAGAWRYSHGEVRMFRAHVERCHVQGGTGAGGSHVLDYGRAGSCEHQIPESKANQLYDLKTDNSPFLFVCGDDRVIRYTGADVDTGGAEDVQMAE